MGNLLGAPVTEKDTHSGATPEGVKYAVTSMQGWRVHMEDAHIAEPAMYATLEDGQRLDLPGHALFAVFDGHGGSYAALYAGRNLCRVLAKQSTFGQYAQNYTDTTSSSASNTDSQLVQLLETAMTHAFLDLDQEIACALKGQKVADADAPYHGPAPPPAPAPTEQADAALQQMLDEEGDSGTTACVILLTPDYILCANAGDSRAVCQTTAPTVVPLSYDHKPDDEAEERRIRAAGGFVAGGRVEGDLAVSRGLGDFRFKQMDIVLQGANPTKSNNGSSSTSDDAPPQSTRTQLVSHPSEQKVSPIPDIILHKRNAVNDAFCLIACDGIWDVQSNEAACELTSDLFATGEADVGLICEEVCDVCLRMGSKDNMTTLVLQFPAQKVGAATNTVLQRRQQRETEANATEAVGTGE